MELIAAASLAVLCLSACLVYRHKRKKRAKCMVFQKRRLSRMKRRRHTLLDRDRGKVISFPMDAATVRHGVKPSDSWQNK